MATWLEIRCEGRGSGFSQFDSRRCWSDDNEGPHGMAADDNASILELFKELKQQAKESGWKRKSNGWHCPACIANKERKGNEHTQH